VLLTRAMRGNYMTDVQDESLSGNSTSANAMTAQVFNAQGHIAITAKLSAMTVKEHVLDTTIVSANGG
jgi:hypothetical protein